jgi:hypothetical protein
LKLYCQFYMVVAVMVTLHRFAVKIAFNTKKNCESFGSGLLLEPRKPEEIFPKMLRQHLQNKNFYKNSDKFYPFKQDVEL